MGLHHSVSYGVRKYGFEYAITYTPHGRGHITGYVKHFCSFYVDIAGDNP